MLNLKIICKLSGRIFYGFASGSKGEGSLINVPDNKYVKQSTALKENLWRDPDVTHKKSLQTHKSNGEYLIHKVPVIHSHQSVVRCIGGTELNTGHPQVYIQLDTKTPGQPVSCKWCGLRFALAHHH